MGWFKNIILFLVLTLLVNGCTVVVLESSPQTKLTENNKIIVKTELKNDILNIKCEEEKTLNKYSETKEVFIRKEPWLSKNPLLPLSGGVLVWLIAFFSIDTESNDNIDKYSRQDNLEIANIAALSVFAGSLFLSYPS
ncbi:MAG: hypothetical protein CSB55_03850 [Candidatus Cloacimonadota bacterium]|nr:MAG: hypothetical protein CSB55_03850 [Candidatus Cloacimonadota bacterium]